MAAGISQVSFPVRGGLDLETPAIAMPPGRAISTSNYEMQQTGAQRTQGFERYDGHPAPSAETFSTIPFSTGVLAFNGGDTVTGATSGATARVIAAAEMDSGSFSAGNAVGILPVQRITGVFVTGELLKVGGVTHATSTGPATLGDPTVSAQSSSWLEAAQDYARGLIGHLDTVGGIRGVLIYQNLVYAFSDNGANGGAYAATSTGWSLRNLKTQLIFTGGVYKPIAGPTVADTITGVTSGATAKVRAIFLDSGDYATSNAAGIYIIDTLVGNFTPGEQVRVGVGQIVGIATTTQTAVQLPLGGRYEFEIFNFLATGSPSVYAVNGVGQPFEFTGSLIGFITTGAPVPPHFIAEHKNQLFLASSDVISSVVGEPRNFSGVLGAAEIGVGGDVTNIIGNTDDMMMIFTATRFYTLTGNDSSDFLLSPQGGPDNGAKAYTAQRVGQVIYLDDIGVRSAQSGAFYGNIRIGTYTTLITKELMRKQKVGITPVASCVVKSKSQYLLFFSDGSGISLFFGMKQPEPMMFQYPFVVSCTPAVAEINGVERVFVGATNGYVYELNSGTSFDGLAVPAFLQLAYGSQGDQRLVKRYMSVNGDIDVPVGTVLGLITKFNQDDGEQPFTVGDSLTPVDYSPAAPVAGTHVDWFVDGTGLSLSPIFVSDQASVESHTISAITVVFKPRGHKR